MYPNVHCSTIYKSHVNSHIYDMTYMSSTDA